MSDGTTTWTYTYDSDGLRTKRTDGTNTYQYTYVDGLLSYMTINGEKNYYVYDALGTPLNTTYQGNLYYYVTNLQGDVIALLDSSGTAVVQYTYDAWGNTISMYTFSGNTFGALNPLRYRGYVYDTETGLYYLQSRYYNPEVGRFINADAFASTGQGLTGTNMFAYCGNNPVNRVDYTGQFWESLIDFIDDLGTEIRNAISSMAPAYAGSGLLAVADGPLVIGEIGLLCITLGVIGYSFYQTATAPAIPYSRSEEKKEAIASTLFLRKTKKPVVFPADPNNFNPYGLTKEYRAGTINGSFISWMDPLTNTEIFRWDENPNKSNGPHYHINDPIYKNADVHFYPETVVPEPYSTIYFPFG